MSKLGLALGGGGARGLAHVGVLKVLEREKIKIHSIAGCSMGAVIGGLYCYFGNAEKLESFVYDTLTSPAIKHLDLEQYSENNKKKNTSIFEKLVDYVEERVVAIKATNDFSIIGKEETNEIFDLIPDVEIKDLTVKFSAIATDLVSGEEVNFTEGNLRLILKASSAIPGIFPPVKIGEMFLVDGGASESVPVGKVKEIGADRIIAIDVTRNLRDSFRVNNAVEVVYRSADIATFHLSLERLGEADLIIRPNVGKLSWSKFDDIKNIIKMGEIETEKMLPEINKLIDRNYYLLEFGHFLKKFKR